MVARVVGAPCCDTSIPCMLRLCSLHKGRIEHIHYKHRNSVKAVVHPYSSVYAPCFERLYRSETAFSGGGLTLKLTATSHNIDMLMFEI